MNNAIALKLSNGMTLTLSPATDARIAYVSRRSIVATSAKAAREIAGELRAWGLNASHDRYGVAWCSVKGLAA